MTLNADLTCRVVVGPDDYQWVDSPAPGVERMFLEYDEPEKGRSTTIVRFAPFSEFPFHEHGGGEEILVLEGAFSDEYGRYPKGTYLRNPPGSKHWPKIGAEGATILVKLNQFSEDDTEQKLIDTHSADWSQGLKAGLTVLGLHEHKFEHAALVRWAPDTLFSQHSHWGGEEIFVLEGTFHDEHGSYPSGSWIRSPHGSVHTPYSQSDGALIYVKVGHLGE